MIAALATVLGFVAGAIAIFAILSRYAAEMRRFLSLEQARFQETQDDLFFTGVRARTLVAVRYGLPPAALAVAALTGRWVFGVLVAAVCYLGPKATMNHAVERRRRKLEAQVQDVISSLAATTKSGMNLVQSIEEVARKLPPPMAQEFEMLHQRIRSGQTVEAALRATDDRLALPRLSLVLQSILVSQVRGGRLTSLLARLAGSLREIERVEERIRTETSGIRLSSKLMASMPLVLMGILYLMSPDHVGILFDTAIGNAILVVVVVLDYIGFTIIKKVGEVDF